MTTAKIWPVPEILEEEPFQVLQSGHKNIVCTDLQGKVMHVPTTDDAFGRHGRMHEMAHVAITPEDGMQRGQEMGINPEYLNVAEDMRVNVFIRNSGLYMDERALPQEFLEHQLKGFELSNDLKGATLMACCLQNTAERYSVPNRYASEFWHQVQELVAMASDRLSSDFESALGVAKWLHDLFENNILGNKNIPSEFLGLYEPTSGVEWGRMEIKTPVLTKALPQRRLNRRVKPQEMGANLMFPSRLDNDDKIFGHMRRVPGGTVLIDVSGSMDLAAYQIAEIIQAVPGATVAVYSGDMRMYQNDPSNFIDGHLTVVAAKGNMLNFEGIDWPGGNVVDGPALRWLARQPEPRVWVCDGRVTGVDDASSLQLTAEAFDIVANNKIRRTPNVEEVAKLLKK